MDVRRWFLYTNDFFEGYAPNRLKARSWCLGYSQAGKTIDEFTSGSYKQLKCIREGIVYKAEYKSIREGI